MNGHKFIAHQFYQIMKCAYCGEFLLKGSGYQCDDCRYTCHKECFPKVVTKCISKSTGVSDSVFLDGRVLRVVSYVDRRMMKTRSIIVSHIALRR